MLSKMKHSTWCPITTKRGKESPIYVVQLGLNKINKSVKVWDFGGKQISYIELEYGVTYRIMRQNKEINLFYNGDLLTRCCV